MLWLKAFHMIFVVTWFAGLFYLPRLFVYHREATEAAEMQRLQIMERRLLIMTHIGGGLASVFGFATLWWFVSHAPDYFKQGWLHTKLTLVLGLYLYHFYCGRLVREFRQGGGMQRSSRWYRMFNEVPGLLLIAIVILVIVRPF